MTKDDVARLRARQHLTQAALARLLGLTPNALARLERGDRGISEPLARLLLFVARELEQGGTYAEYLATIHQGKKKKEKERT